MAKKKSSSSKKTTTAKRKSTGGSSKSYWMDKAKLGLGLFASLSAITMADRFREGKSLNPFSKDYYTT